MKSRTIQFPEANESNGPRGSNDSCDYRVSAHRVQRVGQGWYRFLRIRCGPLFVILPTRDIRAIEISTRVERVERVAVSYIDFVEWKSLDEKEKFFNNNDDVNSETYIFICTILWIK